LIEHGLASAPTQYRLYGRRFFYRSKDPSNSIKVLKKKLLPASIRFSFYQGRRVVDTQGRTRISSEFTSKHVKSSASINVI